MRRVLLAAIAFALCLPAWGWAQSGGRTLVMPFDNTARERRLVWLGEAAALLLSEDMNALGAQALTRDQRREAFARLQVPDSASLTDATVIRIAQLAAASHVVTGSLQLEGETLIVQARLLEIASARVRGQTTARGPIADLFAIFRELAAGLSPLAGGGTAPVSAAARTPSVAAFENYVKGLVAETPATALSYLNAALQAQPDFDRVRLAIWEIHDELGQHAEALAAVARIARTSDVWARARFLAGLSQINLQRYDEAFQTFKVLSEAAPTAAVLNNLGVIQSRRPSGAAGGTAAYFFDQAAVADPTDGDYFFNLGYAAWRERDLSAASYWLREAVRRDPTDGDAHYVLGAVLAGSGTAAEAAREKELARRLSSLYEEWERRPGNTVPQGLERLKRESTLAGGERIEATIANAGQRDQRELARFYLDRGRRLFQQEQDRDALAELNRALFLAPYEAEAHLLVGRIHLRGGRQRDAVDAFKISLWSQETAAAHGWLSDALLAGGDEEGARAEAARALAMDPANAPALDVQRRLAPR